MKWIASLMVTTSTTMFWLSQPLSLGLALLLFTILMICYIGWLMTTFLYSYVLTMMLISGVLVLFMYMICTASNTKFKQSLTTLMAASCLMWALTSLIPETYFLWKHTPMVMLSPMFYNKAIISISMFILLLMVMIMVTYISESKSGPLKSFY